MDINKLKLGMIVYHREIYKHREPLKLIGIKENEIEVEGDLSGGTHNIAQKTWLPLKGTSLVYNYAYKSECREKVLFEKEHYTQHIGAYGLLEMILNLTQDVSLNGEF